MSSRVSQALKLASEYPLDFTIQYPPRREYFQERFHVELPPWGLGGDWLLYVHVPFCERKCHYCNFAVNTRADLDLQDRYIQGLIEEIECLDQVTEGSGALRGIDIGGGTPTILPAALLARLLSALTPWTRRAGPHGLSIETTPSIAAEHPEQLHVLRAGGVARVSMGVQSTSAALLKAVNRSGQQQVVERAAHSIRGAGFERMNVDLIFGLPGQTASVWEEDLKTVIALGPDSITTYDCLYRGKGRALTRTTNERPGPEHYGALYDLAYERLVAAGYYARYGSVNFSLHPEETGTSCYFEGRLLDGLPYVGLGNYASSQVGELWWFAPSTVKAWLQALGRGEHLPVGDAYRLPPEERMAKYLLLSLSFGIVDPARFRARFGEGIEARYDAELDAAIARRWLEQREGLYRVRAGAFGALPALRALFYSEGALEWLESQVVTSGLRAPSSVFS